MFEARPSVLSVCLSYEGISFYVFCTFLRNNLHSVYLSLSKLANTLINNSLIIPTEQVDLEIDFFFIFREEFIEWVFHFFMSFVHLTNNCIFICIDISRDHSIFSKLLKQIKIPCYRVIFNVFIWLRFELRNSAQVLDWNEIFICFLCQSIPLLIVFLWFKNPTFISQKICGKFMHKVVVFLFVKFFLQLVIESIEGSLSHLFWVILLFKKLVEFRSDKREKIVRFGVRLRINLTRF